MHDPKEHVISVVHFSGHRHQDLRACYPTGSLHFLGYTLPYTGLELHDIMSFSVQDKVTRLKNVFSIKAEDFLKSFV